MGKRSRKDTAKIYEDPEGDNMTQERRIRKMREEGNRQKEERRNQEITVDLVLGDGGIMQLDMANAPVDIVVTVMLKELPIVSTYEITKWFQRRFRGGTVHNWFSYGSQTRQQRRVVEAMEPSRLCQWRGGAQQRSCSCSTTRRNRRVGEGCIWEPTEE